MRYSFSLLAASTSLVAASQSTFSVHDDLLAFPQTADQQNWKYEVIISDNFISHIEAESLIAGAPLQSHIPTPDSKDVEHAQKPLDSGDGAHQAGPTDTYESLWLHDQEYLCSIPTVRLPPRNTTSEAEKRAEEQKELARATDRGWELLKQLDGQCLYFISGWWSYAFCYNKDVTQFHQLPMPPGKAGPPLRDPNTAQYVLGRVPGTTEKGEDDYGNEVQVRKVQPTSDETPLHTDIQVKGDTKYLVQRLEGGTTCDLTGKPRKVEVQYHCSANIPNDRIGWIKEVTTCSYVMVVYTPRLCDDVAFQPSKEVKANVIACRPVVPEDELSYWSDLKTLEYQRSAKGSRAQDGDKPINIGGIILGAQQYTGKDGARLPLPDNFATNNLAQDLNPKTTEIVARAKAKGDGGHAEVLSDEVLRQMDLDPKVIEQLKKELEKISEGKGWRLEVIEVPGGEPREIRGIVDGEDGDAESEYLAADEDGVAVSSRRGKKDKEEQEGSEETYKEEL